MRFNQLDLTRYGKFTDFSIRFGDKPAQGPDLHVIYGPNEAGKSTTFAAILDLLYGIEKRSKYGFKHPYNTMQLEGIVEVGGKATRFTRLKRDHQSLLDAQGLPIADAVILADLGGIERPAFQNMFSLDDETLEQGGESILASRGALGELLFSASSGLSLLSQKLVDLRGDTDRFFKPRGHSHELAQRKKELDAIKSRADALDVAASAYAKLMEARQAAADSCAVALSELATARTRLERLRKDLLAHPKYQAVLELKRKRDALPDIPPAPVDWLATARHLEVEAAGLETAETLNAANVVKVSGELSAIVVDERIRRLAAALNDLQLLRARHLSAVNDLPARKDRLAETKGAIAATLKRLDMPADMGGGDLILPPTVRGHFDDLLAEHSRLSEHLEAANAEHDRAAAALREADENRGGRDAARDPLSDTVRHRLLSAIEAVQASDHAARKQVSSDDHREKTDILTAQLRDLRPWTGHVEALGELAVPARDIVCTWLETEQERRNHRKQTEADILRLEDQAGDAQAQLGALETVGGLVTDGEAQKSRRDRETAWLAHQSALDAPSAARFETAMRHDDEIGATRLARASDLARINELSVQHALSTRQLEDRRASLARLDEDLAGLEATIAGALSAIFVTPPDGWSAQQLLTWLDLRSRALATCEDLRRASTRIASAEADEAALATVLRGALEAAGEKVADPALAVLVSQARERLDADTVLRASEGELARLRRDQQARKAALATAQTKLAAWQTAWEAACASCWLGSHAHVPTPAVVRRIFVELETLSPLVATQADLDYRIAAMEHDQTTYAGVVARLAADADLATGLPAFETDQALVAALTHANAQALARDNAEARLADLRAEGERLAQVRAQYESRLAKMAEHFAVTGLAAVLEKLEALADRRDLQGRIEAAEEEVLSRLGVATLGEAQARLEAFDDEAARLDIESMTLSVENDENRLRDLFAEKRRCEDAVNAVDGDDAVARLEEQKRTLLLQIEDGALQWLRLKLGISAAEQALGLYRERHRSSLLVRASEAFALVSNNAYTRLSAVAEKDGEILVAIAQDGSSKRASELSKGTRFQLYLALRVGGYQELISRRPAVPFIADDILETFDDVRAEETLKVFGQMATFGQVIYLTHHKHLCDIARQVCPSVRIHELAARAGTL